MARQSIREIFAVLSSLAALAVVEPGTAAAQCQEFCAPPPCYRAPDDPDCNPDCHCDAPDYPACDPYCQAGELCDPSCGNPCFDDEFGDTCSDPPPPCEPDGSELPFEFIDDQDQNLEDDQIFARGDVEPFVSCGTLRVEQTGYYAIFDSELSESCSDQQDETGYLTIENSCNGDGWATERNAADRFLVFDSDNSPPCETDEECGDGEVCREGNSHGRCCVPEEPVFMGTFLLVAGEDNRLCINHWCPEWRVESAEGTDFGFVVAGCEGSPNSIHFQVAASALACVDETTLQPCSWGCRDGECLPDPCDAADCDDFCKDGECLDENPCDGVTCLHGCVRGRCLQAPNARGLDDDGDGFSYLADCDDTRADVSPTRPEQCGNDVDDDCDGVVDEACGGMGASVTAGGADASTQASGSTLGGDGGPGADGGAAGGGEEDDGCGCRAPGGGDRRPGASAFALAFFTALALRRQRA